MRVFGLTGGIASGKSTVGRRIASHQIPVVDADVLARQAVAKGSLALAEIVATFGAAMLTGEGELDRGRLGDLVFSDESARKQLNAIVHPRVAQLALERFAELSSAGHLLVCYEVPLLVENGLSDLFRPVVLVASPPAMQLARLMARDGLSREAALARIAAQLPLEEKRKVADLVVENDGTPQELEARTDALITHLRASLSGDET